MVVLQIQHIVTKHGWKSQEQREELINFISVVGRPFPKITNSYGVLEKVLGQASRGTFIINDEGILLSMTINPAWVGRSVDETVRTLQALQTGKILSSWMETRT